MAFNLYIGVMGAGKTHEAVKELVCKHLAVGRGVVTNISGVNPALVAEYVGREIERKIDRESGASGLKLVSNEDVLAPDFLPTEAQVLSGQHWDCVVQPGDLVIIDEGWRFYQTGQKILPSHMDFFRMHRHLVHPVTGQSCDVVVLIQDSHTLHRTIRSVTEMTWSFKKLRSIGLNGSYVVTQYDGSRATSSTRINRWNRKYDKAIFALYKSHAVGDGALVRETNIDSRTILWRDPKFIIFGVLGLFAIVFGPFFLLHQMHRMTAAKGTSGDIGTSPGTSERKTAGPPPASDHPKSAIASNSASQFWRVAGSIVDNKGVRWALVDDGKTVRPILASQVQGTGVGYYVEVEGHGAASFGMPIPASSSGKSIF